MQVASARRWVYAGTPKNGSVPLRSRELTMVIVYQYVPLNSSALHWTSGTHGTVQRLVGTASFSTPVRVAALVAVTLTPARHTGAVGFVVISATGMCLWSPHVPDYDPSDLSSFTAVQPAVQAARRERGQRYAV
jgi:hypothetical protein